MADDDAPPGVPEWVVTYGDMMSLLLTFFIMLVSLSEVRANQKYRAVLESLHRQLGYFSSPSGPAGENFSLNSLIERISKLGAFSDQPQKRGGIKAPQTVSGDDHRVFSPRQGKSIPAGNLILFEPLAKQLASAEEQEISRIAASLAGKPNKIEVRGHVSPPVPPATATFEAQLQLSYERARLVFERLEAAGIERARMRIVAVADHEPLPASPNADALRNDRVEVLILDALQKDFVPPRESPR